MQGGQAVKWKEKFSCATQKESPKHVPKRKVLTIF